MKELKLRLRSAGLLSVAAGFMLFLYAPLEIYFNNKYEFWFDFYDLIPLCLLMFAVFMGASFLLAFIVSKINTKLYQGFVTVYLIAFLCTYIQGNFMIGNLPPWTEVRWIGRSIPDCASALLLSGQQSRFC